MPSNSAKDFGSIGTRTLEVHYKSWNVNIRVVDQASQQQLYSLSGAGLGNRLDTQNSRGQVVGTGHTSFSSSSVTVQMAGINGATPGSFETHTGKMFGGSPKFDSPAFGGQRMTWKNKAMSSKIVYTLIDERGLALAHFESAGMSWKRMGTLQIVNQVQEEKQVDEIVVTVLTLLYRKLTEMNLAAIV